MAARKKTTSKKAKIQDLTAKKDARGGSLNFTKITYADGSVRPASTTPTTSFTADDDPDHYSISL